MSREKGKLNPRRGRERPTLKNFLPKISSSNRAEIGSGKAADAETKATHFLGKNPEKIRCFIFFRSPRRKKIDNRFFAEEVQQNKMLL